MVFIPQMLTQENSTENVTEPYSVRSQPKSHLPFGGKASQVIAFQLRMIESRTLSTASWGDFHSSEVEERVQAKWEVPGYFTTITECRFKAIQIVMQSCMPISSRGHLFWLCFMFIYLFLFYHRCDDPLYLNYLKPVYSESVLCKKKKKKKKCSHQNEKSLPFK